MIIIPNENIRKYIAYSYIEGTWLYATQMPIELIEEFENFKQQIEISKDTARISWMKAPNCNKMYKLYNKQ